MRSCSTGVKALHSPWGRPWSTSRGLAKNAKRPQAGWASFTPIEVRVVEVVVEVLTNPQIVEKMFIARGTVKVHLSPVFTKIGV